MRLVLLILAVGLTTPLAAAQSVPERLADLRLATAVRIALVQDPITRPADLDVAARDGRVTLSGDESDIPDVRRLAEVARDVPGVRSVSGLGAERLGDVPDRPPVVVRDDTPPAPPRAQDGASLHVVVRGDTLFGIARRYDTTVEAIEALNGLETRSIRIGQRLRVR